MTPPPIVLKSCPKAATGDLDKARVPGETIKMVRARLAALALDIVAEVRRIDVGRLDIPVFLSVCGQDARQIMPTRKQMGKGSSPAQAEASALMELMERYAFFTFQANPPHVCQATWSEAQKKFGSSLLPISAMLKSVAENMDEEKARRILDLRQWQFCPATCLSTGEIAWLPLDWFRMLGEFNGASAGNTAEESLLQGVCELIERHVCCLIDRQRPVLAAIDQDTCADPVLRDLLAAFRKNGINLILKDFSFGMPLPTVAALAWDPATFPDKSEIVLTAGTATSPAKAAIRAVTEVAQLGGDFCTGSCYEASGLPKFASLDECQWLLRGSSVPLDSLPDAANEDICAELEKAIASLPPVYAVETTNPDLGIPAHYAIIPGLQFRERDKNQSLGLFVGRKLAEEADLAEAAAGLDALEQFYPGAHFLPFFRGLICLRQGSPGRARSFFRQAFPAQPDNDAAALAVFYHGYAHTLEDNWADAVPSLEKAALLCPGMREYVNLLGVALYKTQRYAEAEQCFDAALRLDKGSALDLANRGVCRKSQGKNAAAREDLLKALALDPSLSFARDHLGALDGES